MRFLAPNGVEWTLRVVRIVAVCYILLQSVASVAGSDATLHHETFTFGRSRAVASTLQELRKQAGYRTAPEFARAMDIPESTYARYESSPNKIPIDKAWKLADFFGCSIDAIVEREYIEVKDARGEIQGSYDNLSPDSKIALEKYLSFLVQSDAHERVQKVERMRRRYEELAHRYEVLYLSELEKMLGTSEFLELGDPIDVRDDFSCFVQSRLAEKQAEGAPEDDRYLEKIMEAYDRIHGITRSKFEYVDASYSDFSDRLFISFDSTVRAERGGEGGK